MKDRHETDNLRINYFVVFLSLQYYLRGFSFFQSKFDSTIVESFYKRSSAICEQTLDRDQGLNQVTGVI